MNLKNNPVIVMGNENGQVVTPNENNPEQGSIWLTQTSHQVDLLTNFINKKTRNAWIKMPAKDLLELGYKVGDKLPGNIVRIESFEPFSKDPEYADRDLKIAGDTNIVCKQSGQAIYSITRYTPDETMKDHTIDHDNGEEIKAAQAAQKAAAATENAVKPNADFSIGG